MVLDSEQDKQLLIQVIESFPMSGHFGKIEKATLELQKLRSKVAAATIKERGKKVKENRPGG